MPLFFSIQPTATTQVAVWHIVEPDLFFISQKKPLKPIAHRHKKVQHLAALLAIEAVAPNIVVDKLFYTESGVPQHRDAQIQVSFSHSKNYAAAIVNTAGKKVGVDVEVISPKASKLHPKFLTENEVKILAEKIKPLDEAFTLGWSVKETIFKWWQKKGVDFKKNLLIKNIRSVDEVNGIYIIDTIIADADEQQQLSIAAIKLNNECWLSYTVV